MRLEHVRFGAFKSMYATTCDFSQLTAVTGPNGAGKSNLVDGLAFIGEAYHDSLEIAVARAGGYDRVAHRRTRRARAPVSISLIASLKAYEMIEQRPVLRTYFRGMRARRRSFYFQHDFSLRAENTSMTSRFSVQRDEIRLFEEDAELLRIARRRDGTVEVEPSDVLLAEIRQNERFDSQRSPWHPFVSAAFSDMFFEQQWPSTDLIINMLPIGGSIKNIARVLSNLKVFQLSPNQCRQSGVPTPSAMLSRYGENLPVVADYLRNHSPEDWDRVSAAMRSVIPHLEAIEVVHTEDRRLALQFREVGVGRPWNANEMSDGTIQTLALFVALFDNRTPLLVVEEPENSLHPWILRHFIDLCRSSPKQILLTTHSPILMNYLDHSSLRFMWQREGRSHYSTIESLDPDLVALWGKGEIPVFDAYDQGLFRELVPQHFGEDAAAVADDA